MNLADVLKLEGENAWIQLALLFRNDPTARLKIIEEWPFDREWQLPDSFRLAVPDTATPEFKIWARLAYYPIVGTKQFGDKFDWRDVLVDLSITWHSARIAGFDADALFRETVSLTRPPLDRLLLSFADRAEADKSMDAFCLEEVLLPNGYREIRFPRRSG